MHIDTERHDVAHSEREPHPPLDSPAILITQFGAGYSGQRAPATAPASMQVDPRVGEVWLLRAEDLTEVRRLLRVRFGCERRIEAASALSARASPRDRAFVDRFCRLVEARYHDATLRVVQLGAYLAVSERVLQRRIKSLLGCSPNEYVRTFRLNKASKLLVADLGVAEVAERVGFASHAYFASCFKARYGITPSEYRASAS